eukprot:GHVU01219800.1.p2 GENE.GHVU01219800.1~~GHVU01219800.1.p2  ORF type:complete len:477 (-),score=57.74 GHVU01219800.1:438-1868(-)
MQMAWLTTLKQGAPGEPPQPKARWICRGYMDMSRHETYAGTPDAAVYRLFIIYTLARNWRVQHVDAETAFLQAPISGDVEAVVIIDKNLPQLPPTSPFPAIDSATWQSLRDKASTLRPGQYRQLRRALYGDRRSAFFWGIKLRHDLEALGYQEVAESLFVRTPPDASVPSSIVLCHVDDLAVGGDDVDRETAAIKSRISCKAPAELSEGTSLVFLGTSVTRKKEGVYLSNDHYITNTPDVNKQAVRAKDLVAPREEEVVAELMKEYRSLNGQLGWVVKTRPDQAIYFSLLSKWCHKPTHKLLTLLKCVLLGIKNTPCPLMLVGIVGRPSLLGFSDAAFKLNDLKSRGGTKIFLSDEQDVVMKPTSNLVTWSTREIKILHDSSTSGELLGLKMLVKQIWFVKDTVKAIWGVQPKIRLFVDNQPLVNQIRSGKCKEEPAMQQHLDYVIQEIARLEADLKWIPRDEQVADAMTKPIWFA